MRDEGWIDKDGIKWYSEEYIEAKQVVARQQSSETENTARIKIKLLERIAEYYNFPVAAFFGDEQMFKEKTRSQALIKKAQLLDKIKELIEEGEE